MSLLRRSIEMYIDAKDGNRPHLMADAFEVDAELAMKVETDEISFPTQLKGVDDISTVLVSQFARTYENIYTFCIGTPPGAVSAFHCKWLVCMTEKASGAVRVGFGRYAWHCSNSTGKISRLQITIQEMKTLPVEVSPVILGWAQRLPYPWCPQDLPAQSAPNVPSVQRITQALSQSV
ncbi:hypothetical protein SAMN05446635_6742 [Burkholderia sp. OK233]|nr:hypothetical protein SAMN05446635_6742 [Burkholderia sp. OK233]